MSSSKVSEKEKFIEDMAMWLAAWKAKRNFLIDQISLLEKLSEFPLMATSAYLLKCQFIEFELRQLIVEIELHLNFSSTSRVIRREPLTPIKTDEWTLGQIRKHLLTYESKILIHLQQDLKELNDIRNMLAHHLFSSKDIKDLTYDSQKAIPLANKVIEEIEEVKKKLEENDPLKRVL